MKQRYTDYIKASNLSNVKDITNKITNILVKQEDWNNSPKMENEIITFFQHYEIDLNIHFPVLGFKLYQLLKKEFINNLIFGEENYSILHIAVLNDWPNLVACLTNNWLIDGNYKDSSGNTAWNYACMLLQSKIALLIKTKDQLMSEDKEFLKQFSSISTNWNSLVEQENDKLASESRKEINSWQDVNSIDLQINGHHHISTLAI